MQRVRYCADAPGDKARQGTCPKQVRGRRISDRPNDNGERHDSHDGNGEQALEQALARHKLAPMGSRHQNQIDCGKSDQGDKRNSSQEYPRVILPTRARVLSQEAPTQNGASGRKSNLGEQKSQDPGIAQILPYSQRDDAG